MPTLRGPHDFLVAEFISPKKVYTFSFIVGGIILKSVKCIHSATKTSSTLESPRFEVHRTTTETLCSELRRAGMQLFTASP